MSHLVETKAPALEKRSVLGSFISTGRYQDFLDQIFFLAEKKIPSYVCFANVHMVVEAHRDAAFRRIVNAASVVAPDGKPLSIFLRIARGLKQDRVCGMDMFPDILQMAEAKGKSVYFFGTTPELLKAISQKAAAEFPALKIAGYHSPPFRDFGAGEKSAIVNMINGAKPDLVFVSLGCPRQEKWMSENKDRISACQLGLGQAFKVYAGAEKRLPKWMRNLSLEWMYRFWLEPRRLWKRYLFTNSLFLFLSAKDLARLWIKKRILSKGNQPSE